MGCSPKNDEQISAEQASNRAIQAMTAIDQGIDAIKAQLPMQAGHGIQLTDIRRDDMIVHYQVTISNPAIDQHNMNPELKKQILKAGCDSMNTAFEQGFSVTYHFHYANNSQSQMVLSEAKCARIA